MRKDAAAQEKEKHLRWVLSSGEPNTAAIRTHRLVRICIKSVYKIREQYEENKETFFETKE